MFLCVFHSISSRPRPSHRVYITYGVCLIVEYNLITIHDWIQRQVGTNTEKVHVFLMSTYCVCTYNLIKILDTKAQNLIMK